MKPNELIERYAAGETQFSGLRLSGVKILVYLMRLGNAIYLIPPTHLTSQKL